ncbi:exported hypothetical protein [Vibrio nigripulchritudo MADA3029]|uniref:hypothetical protein n=1 Tax=Vibrio nigripulchritudo TaxID=28173 RepID=UPI0003B1A400|nr:hypothetical protein [Vibrio nigripulchritudo]CCN47123.1 exported hypothetical protein [Vibrio nigripulchritudo MADA3020]CCN51066.1 exported hypothetical protein [Vibrio nigripulchritudo MADA3021]CCN60584.1 exported hypothetical protein [Vibrio nigripulchritudo MADA3029]
MKKGTILFALLSSCFTPELIANQTNNTSIYVGAGINPYAYLGMPYNRDKLKMMNYQCVSGVEVEAGNTTATWRSDKNEAIETIARRHGGEVAGSVAIDFVTVGAGGHLYHEIAKDSYTDTFTFAGNIIPRKKILRPNPSTGRYSVTQECEKYFNPTNQYEYIGEEFIGEIHYGANLLVNMKIEYLTDEVQREAGGYVSLAGLDLVQLEGNLENLSKNAKQNTIIELTAVQSGGQPLEILSIIPSGLMNCSLENPSPCIEAFNNAVSYGKNSIPTQFSSLNDYAVVGYKTYTYREAQIGNPDYTTRESTFLSSITKREINQEYNKFNADYKRANSLLSKYSHNIRKRYTHDLIVVKEDLLYNLRLLLSANKYCNRNPYGNDCTNHYNTLKTHFRFIDDNIIKNIELYPNRKLDFSSSFSSILFYNSETKENYNLGVNLSYIRVLHKISSKNGNKANPENYLITPCNECIFYSLINDGGLKIRVGSSNEPVGLYTASHRSSIFSETLIYSKNESNDSNESIRFDLNLNINKGVKMTKSDGSIKYYKTNEPFTYTHNGDVFFGVAYKGPASYPTIPNFIFGTRRYQNHFVTWKVQE